MDKKKLCSDVNIRGFFLPALFSLLACAAIGLHLEMGTREPLILGFLAGAFLFFRRGFCIGDSRTWRVAFVLGMLLSLCYTLARLDLMADRSSYILYLALRFVGFSLLFSFLFAWLFDTLSSVTLQRNNKRDTCRSSLAKVFLGSWLLIWSVFLFWLMYNWPGEYTNDSNAQLLQILGKAPLSNHHPVAHTMFMGLFVKLGLTLSGGNLSFAVGFYCAVQAAIMAAIFAYLIETLYKFNIKAWVIIVVLACYIFLPYHGSYSSTLWKDVLFGGMTLLLCTVVWRLLLLGVDKNPSAAELVLLSISSLGMCLFRTNGLYAFTLFAPVMLIYFFKKNRLVAILPSLCLLLTFVVKGPVYNSMGIVQPDTIESLSIPAQHIAAVIDKGGVITAEQYALLEKAVDVSAVPDNYHPNNSDYIKILVRESGDQDYIAQNKGAFLRLWAQLGMQNPKIYLQAQIDQTMGYWYPNVDYWYVILHQSGMELSPELGLYKDSLLPPLVEKLVYSLLFYLPLALVAGLVLSIGLAVWVALALAGLCIVNRRWRELILFIPVLAVWATIIIATPVFAEFRYIYCLFTTLPLLAVLPFSHVNNHKANATELQ